MTSGPVAADLILDRARVHTMDAVRRTAMAIALREGTILAVGTSREVRAVAGPATRVVDLGGLTVVPGFDGHPHMDGSAVLLGHQQRHRQLRRLDHRTTDTMTSLMLDVFHSLRKDGFESVFCVSGQGDMLHNHTMAQAIQRGRVESGIRAYFVVSSAWAERLGFDVNAPHMLVYPLNAPLTAYADVHAGSGETSMMWAHCPRLVRDDLIPNLEPTRFDAEDLAE